MRGVPWLAAATLATFAWPAELGSEEQPATQPSARSVRDGVYTEAQAARGKTVYVEKCAECHQADLRGDQQMTPSLVGIGFTFRWQGKTLYDYFTGLRDTMPQGAPGTLGEATYADLVAYLLSEIGYPAGGDELPSDAAELGTIAIEAPDANT